MVKQLVNWLDIRRNGLKRVGWDEEDGDGRGGTQGMKRGGTGGIPSIRINVKPDHRCVSL